MGLMSDARTRLIARLFDIDCERAVALHEAAHAVAFRRGHIPVVRVSIIADDHMNGRCVIAPFGVFTDDALAGGVVRFEGGAAGRERWVRGRALAAGAMAEVIAGADPDWGVESACLDLRSEAELVASFAPRKASNVMNGWA